MFSLFLLTSRFYSIFFMEVLRPEAMGYYESSWHHDCALEFSVL